MKTIHEARAASEALGSALGSLIPVPEVRELPPEEGLMQFALALNLQHAEDAWAPTVPLPLT